MYMMYVFASVMYATHNPSAAAEPIQTLVFKPLSLQPWKY